MAYFAQSMSEEIQILQPKKKKKQEMAPGIHYIQVMPVEAIYERTIHNRSPTLFEKQHGVNSFYYSQPYAPEGEKISDDVDKQYKINTICKTEHFFPFVSRRFKVISEESQVVEPIDSAIKLIKTRVESLRAELNPGQKANTKTLQELLQGSILSQVNVGPLAICKTFFSSTIGSQDSSSGTKLQILKQFIIEFVRLCAVGLKLNGYLITTQDKLQEEMEQAYQQFKTEAAKLIDLGDM